SLLPANTCMWIRALAGALMALAAVRAGLAPAASCFFCSGEEKAWEETEAPVPAYPRTENLIRFDAGGATTHRFYVDAPSVTVGSDGVVRYTLVVKTAGGATNVSFEGIRCATREQKLYAVGQGEGKWGPARDSRWRYIEYQDLNRHHGVLYSDFF